MMETEGTAVCRACGGAHALGVTCDGVPDPRLDAILAEKYRLVRVLGRGGMGSVYEARHVDLGRRFAVKFLRSELARNRTILRRFENEAKAAGSLEHPNLVAVTDIGRAPDGSPYLVMEYLPGEDCSELLARVGPLPVRRAANIVLQACLGLAEAHRVAVVHRDIKPENLHVGDAGDGTDLVKVLDFGIAKLRRPEATAATGAGVLMGTCFYMSPEQIRDVSDVDHRTDVWALGVVLYELLAGRRPFQSDSAMNVFQHILTLDPERLDTLCPAVDPGLVALVNRALEKDRKRRLPSAADMAAALAPFAGRACVTPASGGAPTGVSTKVSSPSEGGLAAIANSAPAISPLASDRPAFAAGPFRKWLPFGVGAASLALALPTVVAGLRWRADRYARPTDGASSVVSGGRAAPPHETDGSVDVAPGAPGPPSVTAQEDGASSQQGTIAASAGPAMHVRTLFEHTESGLDAGLTTPRKASHVAPSQRGEPRPTENGPSVRPAPKQPTSTGTPVTIDPQNPY